MAPSAKPYHRFYVPALDGLRLVAFLMIFWTHTMQGPFVDASPPIPLYGAFRLAGAYGVPVFFVLSAFLITRLLRMEMARDGKIDIRAFYVRRTLRIWPLYFLIVGIAIAHWALVVHHVPGGAVVSLATFTANWYRGFLGPIDSFAAVLWSVSVEEQFYLVWPFLVARLSVPALRGLSVGMIVAALVFRVAVVVAEGRGIFPVKSAYDGMWHASTSHLDALGLGTLLALGAERLPRLAGWRWYGAFAGCFAAMVLEAQWFPLAFRSTPFTLAIPVGYTVVPFAAAGMVALALVSQGSVLERPWAVHLGRLTYGLYVFHLLVIYVVDSNALRHRIGGGLARFLVVFGASYALAWLSYRFYERRFLRLKGRFERVDSRPSGSVDPPG